MRQHHGLQLMRALLTIGCFLLLANSFWLAYHQGVSNSFLLSFGLTVGAYVYTAFFHRLKKIKWLNAALVAAALFFIGLAAFIMVYGRTDTATFREDVAIVLGMGLWGEEPSPGLRSRLERAVEFHQRNPDALIIVSGGQGPTNPISEALAMSRFLQAAGVPEAQIIQEDRSHSTYQNILHSRAILNERFPEGYTVTVITNDFHLFRAISFTRRLGIPGATRLFADTPWTSLPGNLVRECAAVIKMWVVGT